MSKRSRKHNKNITDSALGELLEMINYKTKWYARKCTSIGQYYPSTKTCSNCGYIIDKMPTTVRYWICPTCGIKHDRDANAAINIRSEGIKIRKTN